MTSVNRNDAAYQAFVDQWNRVDNTANTTQGVTSEDLKQLRNLAQAANIDVGDGSQLGHLIDGFETIVGVSSTTGGNTSETNTLWYGLTQDMDELVKDPDLCLSYSTQANLDTVSTELNPLVATNKQQSAKLEQDLAANADAATIQADVQALSDNIDAQASLVQKGTAAGTIDVTAGARMKSWLNAAKAALTTTGTDGASSVDLQAYKDAAGADGGNALTHISADDTGASAAIDGTLGTSKGSGTLGTDGTATVNDMATVQASVNVTGTSTAAGRTGTIPADSALSTLLGSANPLPKINYDASANLFTVQNKGGSWDVYDAAGKSLYTGLTATGVIGVTNPAQGENGRLLLSSDGTLGKAPDENKSANNFDLTGDGTGYTATYNRISLDEANSLATKAAASKNKNLSQDNVSISAATALTDKRTGQIPKGSALEAAALGTASRLPTQYDSTNNLWTVKNAKGLYDIYDANGVLQTYDVPAGSTFTITNPDASISQPSLIALQTDGTLQKADGINALKFHYNLTGDGTSYTFEQDNQGVKG